MKHLQLLGLIVGILFFAGCESTQTAGEGNQEAKRRAAVEQARQHEQPDEAERNLWNASRDQISQDGNNPTGGRY